MSSEKAEAILNAIRHRASFTPKGFMSTATANGILAGVILDNADFIEQVLTPYLVGDTANSITSTEDKEAK